MLHLALVLLPLATAAAVSPVMLTEQAVILAAPGGLRAGWAYAAGVVLVLAGFVGLVVTAGQTLALPQAPRLDASLDLAVGGVLLALAVLVRDRGRVRHGRRRPTRGRPSPARAMAFGVFSMTTDLTSLAFVVPAAKEIASSGLSAAACVVAAALLVGIVCLPAWGPVAVTSLAPDAAGRLLARLHDLLERHGRTLVVVLLAAVGVFLLVRGVARLVVS